MFLYFFQHVGYLLLLSIRINIIINNNVTKKKFAMFSERTHIKEYHKCTQTFKTIKPYFYVHNMFKKKKKITQINQNLTTFHSLVKI